MSGLNRLAQAEVTRKGGSSDELEEELKKIDEKGDDDCED